MTRLTLQSRRLVEDYYFICLVAQQRDYVQVVSPLLSKHLLFEDHSLVTQRYSYELMQGSGDGGKNRLFDHLDLLVLILFAFALAAQGVDGVRVVGTQTADTDVDIWQKWFGHQRLLLQQGFYLSIRKYVLYSSIGNMQSSQLRNIQNIENSLCLLKLKIEKMTLLDSQKEETISKLILNTVPVVDKKIREQKYEARLRARKANEVDESLILKRRNQESRMINSKEVARSKELITTMKLHNSMHLKQSKKINEQKIQKIKQLNLNDKKTQKDRVKQEENKSKAKIQEFYSHKSRDLKMKRQKQNHQNQLKIEQLMQQLMYLGNKEQEMEEKLKSTDQNIKKFRTVIKKVDRMKCDEFKQLKNEIMSPDLKKINSRSLSQAILLYTAGKK